MNAKLSEQVAALETKADGLQSLTGEIIACIHVNLIRETLVTTSQTGKADMAALMKRWKREFHKLKMMP